MSDKTTADQKLDEAGERVLEAIRALDAVLIYRCVGSNDYYDDYFGDLRKAARKLRRVEELLDRRE